MDLNPRPLGHDETLFTVLFSHYYFLLLDENLSDSSEVHTWKIKPKHKSEFSFGSFVS